MKKLIKPRSPSPAAGQGICNQFSQTGSCTFGSNCKFRHVSAAPAPAGNKDQGETQGQGQGLVLTVSGGARAPEQGGRSDSRSHLRSTQVEAQSGEGLSLAILEDGGEDLCLATAEQ